MDNTAYDRSRMERFARSVADRDRRTHPREWIADEDIIAAITGHAKAFANASKREVVLTHEDIAHALRVYRIQRGLRRRPATGNIPLLAMTQPSPRGPRNEGSRRHE
jgi:hypothetical protein